MNNKGWIRTLKSWYAASDSAQRSVYKTCLREAAQKAPVERPMHMDIVPMAQGVAETAAGKWWADRKSRQQ